MNESLDLIKMRETQQEQNQNNIISQNSLIYLINEKEKTANIIGNDTAKGEITIPRSIFHESVEYIITSISEKAFKSSKQIRTVQFAPDSQIQTFGEQAFMNSFIEEIILPSHLKLIDKCAFNSCQRLKKIEIPSDSELEIIDEHALEYTLIESITIPSNLIELREGWCSHMKKLNTIKINPNNHMFSSYGDELIIKKHSKESVDYDEIVICNRFTKQIKIPKFIKVIGPYAFHQCSELQTVEFSDDSELQIIGKESFSESSIERISIPFSVQRICKNAFFDCENLAEINFPCFSELRTIERDAFYGTKIKSITIPANLTELDDYWCFGTFHLNEFIIDPNNQRYLNYENKLIIGKSSIENKKYDDVVFAVRNIEKIKIPEYIKRICKCAFDQCRYLYKVEFSNDSKLEIIDDHSFYETSIYTINIPNKVWRIGKSAFSNCEMLDEIGISCNSELQIIDTDAFNGSPIESITIPSKLCKINGGLSFRNNNLKYIYVSPMNEHFIYLDDKYLIEKSNIKCNKYNNLIFARRNIMHAIIPSFIEKIGPNAFADCINLYSLKFTDDSQLKIIDNHAFFNSSIQTVSIPKHVTEIGQFAFRSEHIKRFDIPSNSELREIGEYAFLRSMITSLIFPNHLTKFPNNSLGENLKIIEIDENSEINDIKQISLNVPNHVLIMIPAQLSILSSLH